MASLLSSYLLKMRSVKSLLWTLLVWLIILRRCDGIFFPSSDTDISGFSKATRWNLPWLGIGVRCNGCPASSCEDDEAVVHGYCCGCAYASDKLPVLCPQFLQCPLNLHGLCHDYEYMMRCCC